MLNIFSSFIDIVVTVVTLLINTIKSFVNLIDNIPTYKLFLISSINVLPMILIPFATISISLYIILFVLGRNK